MGGGEPLANVGAEVNASDEQTAIAAAATAAATAAAVAQTDAGATIVAAALTIGDAGALAEITEMDGSWFHVTSDDMPEEKVANPAMTVGEGQGVGANPTMTVLEEQSVSVTFAGQHDSCTSPAASAPASICAGALVESEPAVSSPQRPKRVDTPPTDATAMPVPATLDFKPENPGGVARLAVDDQVPALKQESGGSLEGELNGEPGQFPSNIVEEVSAVGPILPRITSVVGVAVTVCT